MSWQGILEHDAIASHFGAAIGADRLASTYLFTGPKGIGKRSFALKLATALLCHARRFESLVPDQLESRSADAGARAPVACGACESCTLTAAGSHPDLTLITKPADRSFIPVATFIGDESHRMREGLCHWMALRPFLGGRKIAIIDDADALNEEGANALLKTLEEPPPQSLLILIGTAADRQLPTIRSRCQILRFQPLSTGCVERLLLVLRLVENADEAARLAALSEGSLAHAAELADPLLLSFRARLFERLAESPLDAVDLARQTLEIVEAAGKEAAARRQRTQLILACAAEFFRQLLRVRWGMPESGDRELVAAVTLAVRRGMPESDRLVDCLDRTLLAQRHVDRNAHQAALVECWLGDLARCLTGQKLTLAE